MSEVYAYIGSWGSPRDTEPVGVTTAVYDSSTGELHASAHCLPELNCGATCLDEAKGILYCVNERPEVPGENLGGQVFALKINKETGELKELNRSPSYGGMPSYCAVDTEGKYLIVSNHAQRNSILKTEQDKDGHYQIVREYDETAIVLFRLNEDGSIGEPCDIVRHTGHGALPNQQNPHAHSVMRSPSGDFFVVCDKGNDSVYSYRIDYSRERLVQCDQMKGMPGSSPRYSVFHPTLPILYYNNETKPVIGVVRYSESGKLTPVCYVSCVEDDREVEQGMQSDIRLDAEGRYLYDLVRDTSTIVVYEIDPSTGIPLRIQSVPCGSTKGGRGLALSPDGQYLYLAAQPDPDVYIFRIGRDGKLTPNGKWTDVKPGNVTFMNI
ncbi:MAG: lactonase family protein [Lachnospiraceae bacterium]|nr:lactonase family protein [Lachnospiraceae bacterium]